MAQAPLSARIAQARSYTADPVTLPLAAEQRLNDLMEEARPQPKIVANACTSL